MRVATADLSALGLSICALRVTFSRVFHATSPTNDASFDRNEGPSDAIHETWACAVSPTA